MRIGILEIMPQGHYPLVDSLARIYSSSKGNECIIFTHKIGAENLVPLLNEKIRDIKVIIKEDEETFESFFTKINKFSPEVIFIVTLEKYFSDVFKFNFICPLHLFIHNIDAWFQINLSYNVYNFIKEFTLSSRIIYNFKVNFIYPKWRRKLINQIIVNNGRFVVLNTILKKELKNYINGNIIDVIPFSVYNKDLQDRSNDNKCLRVCIPGIVSQVRRDYLSILDLLENEAIAFNNKIELVLLGPVVEPKVGRNIIKRAIKLNSKGIKIHYYNEHFISFPEFDKQLAKADIILGNMNVILNKYSQYGKTKETGITSAMIRAAKPGILPKSYALIDALKSSTLVYGNYSELKNILKDLIENKEKILSLKMEAQNNSLLFDPEFIYEKIKSSMF